MAALHADGRIAARKEETRREGDLCGGLPAPHRHRPDARFVARAGREVEPRAREVLDVGGDALAIDTVHEEPQRVAAADRAAELHAPTRERGVAFPRQVMQVHVAHDGRSADMARTVAAPGILDVKGNVGHALRDGVEPLAVRTAHDGHLGRHAERESAFGEGAFVADERGEVEVVGIGALKIDGCRGRFEIAEGRHVAPEGQSQQRDVGRAQTRRVAVRGSSAEVSVEIDHHASHGPRVGDRLQEEARRGGVQREFLPRGIVPGDGNVVGHEVDVLHDAARIVGGPQGDESAQRKREAVLLRGEDELRPVVLLESPAVRFGMVAPRVFLFGGAVAAACRGTVRCGEGRGRILPVRPGRGPGGLCRDRSGEEGGQQRRYGPESEWCHKLNDCFR